MSDFKKNILKAGFLVTASLLATGCSDDNKTGSPSSPNTQPPAPGPSTGTTASLVATFTPDLGGAIQKLEGAGLTASMLPSIKAEGVNDVFQDLQAVGASLALSAGATITNAAVKPTSVINLTGLKLSDKGSVLFDASRLTTVGTDKPHVGAIFLEGFHDTDSATKVRNVAIGKVKGDLRVPALLVRNAVLTGDGNASIAAQYAFVAVDSALGYDTARVDEKGAAIPHNTLSHDVHSIPPKIAAHLELSAGTGKAAVTTHANATQTKKVADPKAAKGKASTTVAKAPAKPTAGHLVLKSLKPDSGWIKKLNDAALLVHDGFGGFNIAGRAAEIDASNTVITGVNASVPELWIPEHIAPASGTTTAPKTSAKTKASKLQLSAGTVAASKKPATAGAAKTAANVVKKPATSQALVKTATGHKFLFEIKPGGTLAELGKLKIGENTQLGVIPSYTLTVHELDLTTHDLGVRVLADKDGFDKLVGVSNLASFDATGDKVKNGQALMEALAQEDHSIHESEIVEESGEAAATAYHHYDEHTPFPLYVTTTLTGHDKHKLALQAVDLTSDTTITAAGAYVMPLVKDFTGTLANNEGSAGIVLADPEGKASTTLQVNGWKVMSNGYHDYVLLVEVAAKSGLNLSAGMIDHVLMSAEAQGGRSVSAHVLDAVTARLNPVNLVETSFANLSTSRINQAAQFASLARGVNVATAETLGAVEQYAVSFNHGSTQVGFTYNIDSGNAFATNRGATSLGVNVASRVLGLTAIASADVSVDAGKNAYASTSHASYNAGLTFAKAYGLGGLSIVPMAGFGLASNALNNYSAVVPMVAGSLGLYMSNVSFSAATFHAGVNVALDNVVEADTGVNASLAFGLAGYLASTADATLSTSEGKSADLKFDGHSVAPYAQFNLGFNSGEKVNALISTGIVAVNFGIDR